MSIFNKKEKINKYKYQIIFKDNVKEEGELELENLDQVYDVLAKSNFAQLNNGRKAIYYNENEIKRIYVELIEEDLK